MANGDTSPPTDETPPAPADDAAAKAVRDELQKKCDDEWASYLKEREALAKAEFETEKGYDTLLVTLSTLAIGSSFTILKDIIRSSGGSWLIIIAWTAFGLCLFIALADKLLSYWTHKWFREVLDAEFAKSPWTPGALERARAQYGDVRFIWLPPKFKGAAFIALLLGVVFLLMFVFSATGAPPASAPVPAAIPAATTTASNPAPNAAVKP